MTEREPGAEQAQDLIDAAGRAIAASMGPKVLCHLCGTTPSVEAIHGKWWTVAKKAREDERAAIVAWLRERPPVLGSLPDALAAFIEQGEHRR